MENITIIIKRDNEISIEGNLSSIEKHGVRTKITNNLNYFEGYLYIEETFNDNRCESEIAINKEMLEYAIYKLKLFGFNAEILFEESRVIKNEKDFFEFIKSKRLYYNGDGFISSRGCEFSKSEVEKEFGVEFKKGVFKSCL